MSQFVERRQAINKEGLELIARKVICIGPFPPPVHGMSKNLALLTSLFREKCEVQAFNTSPGHLRRGTTYHATKFQRVIAASCRYLISAVRGEVRCLYLPPDAGFGAFYSLLFVLISKLFKVKIFLHHRSFAYITKPTISMRLIQRCLSDNDTNIFLCDCMRDKFTSVYGARRSHVVSNASSIEPTPFDSTNHIGRGLQIGMLSNLSTEKGLAIVLKTYAKISETHPSIRLVLGGPLESTEAENLLSEYRNRFPTTISYLGPIPHNQKHEFYRSIDVFLFPTQYKNEAQPNVLFESHSFGIPTVVLAKGCISTDVGHHNGLVISEPKDYINFASQMIISLADSRTKLDSLRRSTYSSFVGAHEEARLQLEELIHKVVNS